MGPSEEDVARKILGALAALPVSTNRRLVAIAGPPASGKSTIASLVQDRLIADGIKAGLVPMDGFHLDNSILAQRGLRARKGSPETFDLAGFVSLLDRLKREGEVVIPTFDRSRDISIGSSQVIKADMMTVIVEGNYLLLDRPGWRGLAKLWDFSVFLGVQPLELERRLLERWRAHGLSEQDAMSKAQGNDLPNAALVTESALPADLMISS